ncbi:response regulator transcription factor [Paenibacillus sp. IITD108]|uniref:response regulator transcription factor n=1 Tax=Paenibacillus sp. IITD108 TaxID=3116649 RepID=UPI002F41B0F6
MYRVLIVEDEKQIREGLRQLIENLIGGFKIAGVAVNGKEGLELARALRPDIIITDIRMPVMDGLEMISSIREQFADVDIYILSGYEEFEYAKQALRYRVTDYLLKPISRIELAQTLERYKEKRQAQHIQEEERTAGTENRDGKAGASRSSRKIIREVKEYVQQHLDQNITLQEVAEKVYLNAQYLSYLFKCETGQNYGEFVTEERIGKAKLLLKDTNLKIREISVMCGYTHEKYFMSVFKQHAGVTPSQYREL